MKVYKNKTPVCKNADVLLYGDKIIIDDGCGKHLEFPFAEVTAVAVLGRNKLNIYHDNIVYQLKGGKRFNALKYVNIYFRHKNISKGDEDGKFLGL